MIRTSRQLKALVRNLSNGDSTRAQLIIRNYAMERFLERLSVSAYRDNLILKGGALVSAIVGLGSRSTLDMDATIKNLPLTEESVRKIVGEIIAVQIDDGMVFEIKNIAPIMDDAEYPGIRVSLDTTLETMRTPLKIDFSTGDVITPREVSYSFKLLFEDRTILILAYNLETVLAEKIETLLARSTANSRMRDFYDVFVLEQLQSHNIDKTLLNAAFTNTNKKRGSFAVMSDMDNILNDVECSPSMVALWKNYQRKFEYASDIGWDEVMQAVRNLCYEIK